MGLFNQFPWTNLHEINLEWILAEIKRVAAQLKEQGITIENLEQAVKELGDNIDEKVLEWLQEQGPTVAQEWIAKWIQTSVYFGISDAGYWCAYIPASWKTITFETTGLDVELPIQPEYGHLVLRY